jgi:hypothetical protein
MGPIEELSSGDLGPLEYSGLDDLDVPLLVARERFPDYDIFRLSWGYLAVPPGSIVFAASDVPSVMAKIIHATQGELAMPEKKAAHLLDRRPHPAVQPRHGDRALTGWLDAMPLWLAVALVIVFMAVVAAVVTGL